MKKICLVGFGESNKAVLKLVLDQYRDVCVSNDKDLDENSKNYLKMLDVKYEERHSDLLKSSDIAVVSPGVSPKSEAGKLILREKFFTTEIEVSWEYIKKFNPKSVFVGITGTNGKSTTVSLIGHVLKESGEEVFVGGNIGTPLAKAPVNMKYYILEISSFQIFWGRRFVPEIGVLLNLAPDHLDWHNSLQEYYQTKVDLIKRIVWNGGIAFSSYKLKEYFKDIRKGRILYFGEESNRVDRKEKVFIHSDTNTKIRIFNEKLLKKPFIENLEAAISVLLNLDLPVGAIEYGIKTYKMLPHRLEFVGEINGVKFYNDSKATNIHAALNVYKNFRNEKYIAILSGIPKEKDFSELVNELNEYAQGVVIFGEMKNWIRGLKKVYEVENLEQAIEKSLKLSEKGYHVIFSPGGASFDLYKNYKERGEHMKKIIYKIMEMI